MRVIVIDPNRMVVTERQLTADSENSCAEQIHEIIGDHFALACQIPSPDGLDVCYVDDDGLAKYDRYFVLQGWGHQPYAGIGVIAGSDPHGGTVNAHVDIKEVLARTLWVIPMAEPANDRE